MQKIKKTALVWFRNDLRTLDNKILTQATEQYEKVIGLYVLDPNRFTTTRWGFKKTERFRAQFLLESLADLRHQLQLLGIPLYVEFQSTVKAVPEFFENFEAAALFYQEEWTEEEIQESRQVEV